MPWPICKSFNKHELADYRAAISSRIREGREKPWLRASAGGVQTIWSYALGREKCGFSGCCRPWYVGRLSWNGGNCILLLP